MRTRYKLSASVFALLVRNERVFLLQRVNTGWMDGHYSLPAGAIEAGETLEQAVRRELAEETGVSAKANGVRLVHLSHNKTHGDEWLGAFFLVDQWVGEPKANEPDKHGDAGWFPLDSLPANIIPYVRSAIESYRAGTFYSEFGW